MVNFHMIHTHNIAISEEANLFTLSALLRIIKAAALVYLHRCKQPLQSSQLWLCFVGCYVHEAQCIVHHRPEENMLAGKSIVSTKKTI
jgi:hypothetical protein